MPIYFISLVGTDDNGFPRKALSFFDIFSVMEFDWIEAITFLSVQNLLKYYQDQTGRAGDNITAYELVIFFMKKNPDALYFIDEVPLIKSNTFLGNQS